jgi:hypothetical protein
MSTQACDEFEELRIHVERLRTLLEMIVVRGLRACGPDELAQLQSQVEYLDRAGAGHVSAVLAELHAQVEKDDRAAARTLLRTQTAVRLLERLLTLRIVRSRYEFAFAMLENPDAAGDGSPDEDEGEEDDDAGE